MRPTSRVEVIKSASSAFRIFVKDKKLYRKGMPTHSRNKTINGQNWSELHAINNKMPMDRTWHNSKPSTHVNMLNKRGDSSKSPMSNRNRSLKKPILSSRKSPIDEHPKMVTGPIASESTIVHPQFSTVTLLEDRLLNSSVFQQRRDTITEHNKTPEAYPHVVANGGGGGTSYRVARGAVLEGDPSVKLSRMASVSPTFKRLNEIFAFMD